MFEWLFFAANVLPGNPEVGSGGGGSTGADCRLPSPKSGIQTPNINLWARSVRFYAYQACKTPYLRARRPVVDR